MRRFLALLCLAAAVAGSGAAGAGESTVVEGHIDTASATPTIPRSVFLLAERTNGILGWVATVPASDAPRPYAVEPVTTGPGKTDIDVWFYRDLEGATGTGDPCPRDADDMVGGGERGTACAGARYAVIVLFAGADVSFELTIS